MNTTQNINTLGNFICHYYMTDNQSHFLASNLGRIVVGVCKRDQSGEFELVNQSLSMPIFNYAEDLYVIITKLVKIFMSPETYDKDKNHRFLSNPKNLTKSVYTLIQGQTDTVLQNNNSQAKYTFICRYQVQQFIKSLGPILPTAIFDLNMINNLHTLIHISVKSTSSTRLIALLEQIIPTVTSDYSFGSHPILSKWTLDFSP